MYRFNIILTECCNASCTHCYMGYDKKNISMSKNDIDTIICEIKYNTESVVLTGGEIFLKKELLFYTIKKIKEQNPNIIVKLESNGIYFYKDFSQVEDKLIELKNLGVESIRFSLDPFHESGGIDLEKVVTGASSEAIDLMKQMLQWDPNKRATAKQLLKHPFFTNHTINSYFYTDIQSDIFKS